MPKKSGRGSDRLFGGLAPNHAKALQSAIRGWKIIDWHDLGKPSTEVLTAGISGSPGRLGAVIGKLVKIKDIRDIEILINGQPRPELAQVRFQMRTGARR